MNIRLFRPSLLHLWSSSIYLIRSGDGRISSSILPRWDLFFHRCKERGQLKSWAQRTEIYWNSRKCGGGVCRYGLLYQGTRDWFIWYLHVYTLRVKTFLVYIISTLNRHVRVCTFISSISSSILIFHRSISFDLVTVEFLLLSFHGGISSSIVAKKEDNWKVERKERRYWNSRKYTVIYDYIRFQQPTFFPST